MSKITIIIPVYNTELYISNCLNSVLNQTFNDYECICVDDGSIDNTTTILNEYAARDPRIIILTQKNKGAGAARNRALKIAKSPYIMFLDSDDYLDSNALETFYSKIEENQVDAVISHISNYSNDDNLTQHKEKFDKYYKNMQKKEGIYNINNIMEFRSGPVAKLFKKEIIDKYGIKFAEKLINEDELFHWTYFSLINKIYFIEESLYNRLIHEKSTMVQRDTKNMRNFDMIKILELTYKTLKKNCVYNKFKEQFLIHYNNNAKRILQNCQNDTERKIAKQKLQALEAKIRPFEKLFSIRNNDTHKIITISGVKFKIKSAKLIQRKKNEQIEHKISNTFKEIRALKNTILQQQEIINVQNKSIAELQQKNEKLNNNINKKIFDYEKLNASILKQENKLKEFEKDFLIIKDWYYNYYKITPQKYPIRLTELEIDTIKKYVNNSKNYLEFGSGGSTFLALIHSDTTIFSVESDVDWIEFLKSYKTISNAINNNRLYFEHINIGKTKEWGYPVNDSQDEKYPNYSNKIFDKISNKNIDLVFIDGRFRVACTLNTILNCNKSTIIMFHDYTIREYYHIVEEFLDIIETVDTLAVFKIKEDINIDKLKILYDEYKYTKE